MGKPKNKVRSKEEITHDIEVQKKKDHQKNLVVNDFYPALIEATISVDESKSLLQAMGSLLMEQVIKTMKDRKFSEIKEDLFNVLCKDGERKEEIQKLLNTLTDEDLVTSRNIIEGVTRAVEHTIMEEMRAKKLGEMRPNWEVIFTL